MKENDIFAGALPDNIDELLPIVLSTMSELSPRSLKRVRWLLHKCNDSLSTLYGRVEDPGFVEDIPYAGKKTVPEIKEFLRSTCSFLEGFQDEEAVTAALELYALDSVLGLSDFVISQLKDLERRLGYFPLFAAIKNYLDSRSGVERIILDGCLAVHKGQELRSREDLAAELKLTAERVRQKRNALIIKLPQYFRSYYDLRLIKENPYHCHMNHYEDDVNAAEGTDFSLNFVSWVLGNVFDELTPVGDPFKCIGGYYDTEQHLCLVPSALTEQFDFEAFVADVQSRLGQRRVFEERVALRSFVEAHLKATSGEDVLSEVESACRSVLFLHFSVGLDGADVVFPANAYKTNPIIIEEILRDAGRPLTFEEICSEFHRRYPERDATSNSLRGAIGGNDRILPFGRSGVYGLAGWGETFRGGTIREFVCEYLDSFEVPVAPEADVCAYVQTFRPSTNVNSILSNLLQESGRKFVVLVRDGVRYYGYSGVDYGDEFVLVGGLHKGRRSLAESMKLLEEFILREGRFPRPNKDDAEESRLYRFVGNRRSACGRGVLSEQDVRDWLAFEKKYRSCHLDGRAHSCDRSAGEGELL